MKDRDGSLLLDGRQSPRAVAIQRGVLRVLRERGFAAMFEVTLSNARRADVMAIGRTGEIWIVEIKSSLEDFRADGKWRGYRDYCDRLLFAVARDFPADVLPADTGLILADPYGGEIIRDAPEHKLSGARRKAVTLRFAHACARQLHALRDPDPA